MSCVQNQASSNRLACTIYTAKKSAEMRRGADDKLRNREMDLHPHGARAGPAESS